MSKRTNALAVIIGGSLMASAWARPVAADDSFPFTCMMSDSSASTRPLVVTAKLSCLGNGDPNASVDASLIGPATVHFYSGTDISWTKNVEVPAAGVYQFSVTGTYVDPQIGTISDTYVCCSVQAYGAAAATQTPQPPPPATPPPASTPAPPAPTPKPKPAPAATPTPSPSPTDTPQPTPTLVSATPSVALSPSAEVTPSPPASPSSPPTPAAASNTGTQDPSGVSHYLLAGAVAAVLAILVLALLLGLVKRRRRRRDRLPGQSGPVE